MAARIIVVLGGSRSGKSVVAEREAAAAGGSVTYLATGPAVDAAVDADWARRVAEHRARRPPEWTTVEVGEPGELVPALRGAPGTVLLDALGTWVAGAPGFAVPGDALCRALVERAGSGRTSVVVSEEVGLGVHPPTETGRRFAEALGELNQAVAACAERVLLVVAGRVLELPGA